MGISEWQLIIIEETHTIMNTSVLHVQEHANVTGVAEDAWL